MIFHLGTVKQIKKKKKQKKTKKPFINALAPK